MISFSRSQLTGLCFFLLATGIAVHEYQSGSHTLTGNRSDFIVAQKTPDTPADLTELAEQIAASTTPLETVEKDHVLQIASGDTMMTMLSKMGVGQEEARQAVEAIKRVYDPRELKVGQAINVRYRKVPSQNTVSLVTLSFKGAQGHEIALEAQEGVFTAKKYQIALRKVQKRVEGTIDSSFYSAALKRGIPAQIVREAINALAYDINWQHDPTRGDPFTIVYDAYQDTNGHIVRVDGLKYVAFAPGGKNANRGKKSDQVRQVYRFQPAKGAPGYYDANGVSVVKTLLQTPMDPSKMRLTSKFSPRRKHPVLGFSRAHKGVDFGAPTGTPVRAAGDGVVVKACYWGQYGNYVMVKHNNEFSTAYAHLSRMKVRVGMKVRQNQIIGNVGSTGLATGPHLHFELLRHGVHINPQSVKHVPTTRLNAKDLADFRKVKQQIEKEIADAPPSSSQVASVDQPLKTG